MKTLHIPESVWNTLLSELERRSHQEVESGAFLLGSVVGEDRYVDQCVYYDDLYPEALHPTHIFLPSDAYQSLWSLCRKNGLSVVADVHTHPTSAIQSMTDKRNPMIPEVGHVAFIIPRFAKTPLRFKAICLYVYLGAFRWKRIPPAQLSSALQLNGTSAS